MIDRVSYRLPEPELPVRAGLVIVIINSWQYDDIWNQTHFFFLSNHTIHIKIRILSIIYIYFAEAD